MLADPNERHNGTVVLRLRIRQAAGYAKGGRSSPELAETGDFPRFMETFCYWREPRRVSLPATSLPILERCFASTSSEIRIVQKITYVGGA
jgi:hypothetical protein